MSRGLGLATAAVLLAAAVPVAHADEAAGSDDAPAGNQELGARLGLAVGGRVSPGGLLIGGTYLYRLSEKDWFDGGVGFVYGGGDAVCFRDRQNNLQCDEGVLDGFAAEVTAGIRRFLPGRGDFHPFIHGGLAVRFVSYGADNLRGLAIPLWIGAGVRVRVADGVAVVGGANLEPGLAFMNHGLGIEPHGALSISAGVEFKIQ